MPEWGVGGRVVWEESLSDSRRMAAWVGPEQWQ